MSPYSKQQLRVLAAQGLGARLPDPPKRRKNEEFTLQCALVRWWSDYCREVNVPEFLLWHTPNSAVYGGSKEQREKMGAMLKRMGQRSGVPDLFLAWPVTENVGTPNAYDIHGLFIELKAPKGVISPEQIQIMSALEKNYYVTAVCRTLEDAKQVIQSYLQ